MRSRYIRIIRMNTPKVTSTHIKAFAFPLKMEAVKTDHKDNVIAVDKSTGNVTIYTFDEQIPSNFKQGLAPHLIIFEDDDKDDLATITPAELNPFVAQVRQAGTIFDPYPLSNQIRQKIQQLQTEIREEVNIVNVSDHLKDQLEKASQALDKTNVKEMETWAKNLSNSAKQLFFGRVYVPNYGSMITLSRTHPQIAMKIAEIAQNIELIQKKVRDDQQHMPY